ncbi:hypothetical protein LEN26_007988 [Aphanomyces euteiches]|nr:hypothetical protein LEN26_007988 [Aphanomyces euteiches]
MESEMPPKPLKDDVYQEMERQPRRRSRRSICVAIFVTLGIVISAVVLLLPRHRNMETNSAVGVNVVNGSANVSFTSMNSSHWLPIDDLNFFHKKTASGISNVYDPPSNTLVEPTTRTQIIFRSRVVSMRECAIIARAYNKSFFSWESDRQVCYLNDPTPDMAIDTGANYETKEECVRMCNRTLKCGGMTFLNGICTFYKATMLTNASIAAGWIIPKTSKKAANATVALPRPYNGKASAVHFYITAHQDDHELFMSKALYASFHDPSSKVVFIYLTAGDANRTDGWWQAREVGTLAASKFSVQDFGYYIVESKEETARILGRAVHRVTIGNAVHYMLRLSECNMTVLVKNQPVPTPFLPLGNVSSIADGGYSNLTDVQDVVQEILRSESKNITTVAAYMSEFFTSGNDHELHKATGLLAAKAIELVPRLAPCTSKTFFFGYQYWLSAVNMVDPELSFQRRMWLALSAAALAVYPKKDVWSNHAINLGRTYVSRANLTNATCSS